MTHTVCSPHHPSASLSTRELRALARRLALSERPELRAVARALDKATHGEAYSRRHHEGDDYDPFRCAACTPDLWVVYTIGIAFPDVSATDVDLALAGLHGLSSEDVALALEAGQSEDTPPDVTRNRLALCDRQDDELASMRAELERGWHRHTWGTWARTYEGDEPPPSDPEVDALLSDARARHLSEYSAHGGLDADPALLREIRFGANPRKARAVKRASFRKGQGVDPSWLL